MPQAYILVIVGSNPTARTTLKPKTGIDYIAMTVICGEVKNDGVIVMAADSSSCDDDFIDVRVEPKIFLKGSQLIGVSGDWRDIQVVHMKYDPPKNRDGLQPYEYMCKCSDRLKRLFGTEGSLNEAGEMRYGAMFMFGYEQKLWIIDSSFAVEECVKYGAIGSGSQYALGAMFAANGDAVVGVKAAIRYHPSVIGPVSINRI